MKNTIPILVIIGPSGAGKSTLIRKLFEDNIIKINPTWTTRPKRIEDSDLGIEHKFVTESEFDKKSSENYFLEEVSLFGLPYRYGLPKIFKSTPNKISLVMLRANLLHLFSKHYDNFIVYQIEDSLYNVKKRLTERVQNGENLGTRLTDYNKEIKSGHAIANRIFINTSKDDLYNQIIEAIRKDFRLL